MIERVVVAGASADRPDVVRSARHIGEVGSAESGRPDAKSFQQALAEPSRGPEQSDVSARNSLESYVDSGPAQPLDATPLTSSLGSGQLADTALKALGLAQDPGVAGSFRQTAEGPGPEAASELEVALSELADDAEAQLPDSLQGEFPELKNPLDTALLGFQVPTPDYLQRREYSPAERIVLAGSLAAEGSANLPLEQVEQWLAELQRLQARHGQPVNAAEDADKADKAGDKLALAGLLRTAEQSTRDALQSAQSARSFTVPQLNVEPPLQASKFQLESMLQSVLPDEFATQPTVSRAADASAAALTTTLTQQPSGAAAAPAEVRLQGAESRWGEQMLQALRDQVQTQISQRSQHATIRLDPPELGSLDIQVSHEQGKLNIQINAGQADIARLLAMLSERLRSELLSQNFTEVNVQVGSQSEQGRDGRQRHASGADSDQIAMASDSESGQAKKRDRSGDALISV